MVGPRIAPLPVDRWAPGLLEGANAIVGGTLRADANVYSTIANSPELFTAWLHLGSHLLRRSTLPARERELVILRSTALASGVYPFTQHDRIGREVGLSPADVQAALDGPDSSKWQTTDRQLLLGVDELMVNNVIGDTTWQALCGDWTLQQRLDLIATAAFYRLAAWMLNVCATPLDDGQGNALGETTLGPLPPWTRAGEVRIAPLPENDWPGNFLAETSQWPRFAARPESRSAGVYATLANHLDLFRSLGPLMAYFFDHSSLDDRDRELVIIRSCYRDRGEYPYRQHVGIGIAAGLPGSTVAALGEVAPVLDDPNQATLVGLIDELHDTNTITDETWQGLSAHFSAVQVMDVVALAGFYGVVSFVLSSAGTKLEPGDICLPDDVRPKGRS